MTPSGENVAVLPRLREESKTLPSMSDPEHDEGVQSASGHADRSVTEASRGTRVKWCIWEGHSPVGPKPRRRQSRGAAGVAPS